ncbi:polyphosphate kinase [Thiohalospira halophila DSM 15071]|uniref:Polyphosphate kinase n=1 Tax=Thiohalospira halophila DSM 15071 TaxID=1123397 RepID=A0A1I1P9U9_9GAMM|nr:polyphosphate kinase 1 [Thiohalospira halophila]SFD04428.1 polyphosphate kinase [Thiohalospira halophila DSM 15071]
MADDADLRHPDLYINRELSLLEFNRRVLEQARDPENPLLERLKFLCISSTNLDEFFEVRAAGLVQKAELGSMATGPDNLAPAEALRAISETAHDLVDQQYRTLNEELLPALEAESIRFIRRGDWTREQERWLREYFESELAPVISPLGLDPAHPFPRILNKSLNFLVSLEGKDAFGRSSGVAVVQAPRALPRLIRLPPEATGSGPHDFVFLSSVIHAYVADLFPGMQVSGCYQFRVTRNSDLFVDTEEVDDLLLAVEGELASRRYGDAVRLEMADNAPPEMADYLREKFELPETAVYQVNGPVNLNRLMAMHELVDRPELKFAPFTPSQPRHLVQQEDIFATLRQADILLHHPFESFAPVVDFLRQAAADPQVLAIKQTLYRTGPESAVVDALVDAARSGKEVTVVVELRARFDEAENIALANRLQEAGAHVVYGVVGYKTHAKMVLVVRRENNRLRHYVHLGTGNYHVRTARLYTDYGLLTCDRAIGDDVHHLFLQLTSLGRAPQLKELLQSPFTLHEALIERVEREAGNARAGRPARILAKVNSLVEPRIIQALYAASRAGVEIRLVVRGMCSLRPGLAGISENIEVRSIIGRFLEHTRVFYFENGGDPEVFGSSADWMERNFFRRVETCFPFQDPALRRRVIAELETYLADNTQAWILQSDGIYRRAEPAPGEEPFSAQRHLLESLAEKS